MAMPALWWSLSGSASWRSACRFKNDWSGATVYFQPGRANRAVCYDGDGIWQGVDSSMELDTQWGTFYWVRQNGPLAGSAMPSLGVAVSQTTQRHYPRYLETYSKGDIFPFVKGADDAHHSQRLLGFSSSLGSTAGSAVYYVAYYNADYDEINADPQDTSVDSYCTLYHSQPPVYYGTVAKVISAIIMELIDISDNALGISDFIDTSSFDDAHDAQHDHDGDYGTNRPHIVAYAKYGEPVVDTIKRSARHAWEYLGVGIDTKLCYRERNADSVSTINKDTIVGNVGFSYTEEYLYNKLNIRAGVGRLIYNWDESPADGDTPNIDASNFAGGESLTEDISEDTALYLLKTKSVSASIAKYGERLVPGTEQDVDRALRFRTGDRRRTPPPSLKLKRNQTIPFISHPYFPDIYDLNYSNRTAKYMEQLDEESEPKREITITQNLYGLDYDIGHVVTVDGITGQGDSWEAVCFSKKINFNNLTVTSTLVERAG